MRKCRSRPPTGAGTGPRSGGSLDFSKPLTDSPCAIWTDELFHVGDGTAENGPGPAGRARPSLLRLRAAPRLPAPGIVSGSEKGTAELAREPETGRGPGALDGQASGRWS